MSSAEGASKASSPEQANKVSGVSERANGRASGPVLHSVFLVVLAHSEGKKKNWGKKAKNKPSMEVRMFWNGPDYLRDVFKCLPRFKSIVFVTDGETEGKTL